MIARLRRLERVRARQLDRARADHLRAAAACERAVEDRRAAIGAQEAQVGRALEVGELEQAAESIAVADVRLGRAHVEHARTRERTASAGNAWNRAEQALLHARAEREARMRRDEQREHDELAARRSK